MKNKILAFGIVGIALLTLVAITIANTNTSNKSLMHGMMGNDIEEMMGMMNHMKGMTKMHGSIINSMKESLKEITDLEEKEEIQEMIEHMESCPMMK